MVAFSVFRKDKNMRYLSLILAALLFSSTVYAQSLPSPQLRFQPNGTGAVARTVDAKLKDSVSLADFGVACDGTDETTKIQAALNSGAKRIEVPNGSCTYSHITIPDGVTLIGRNWLGSCLQTNAVNGDGITAGHAVTIRDVCLTASVTRTGNCHLATAANSLLVDHVLVKGYFLGVCAIGTSNAALTVQPQIINSQFSNAVVGIGSGSVVFQNYSNAVFRNNVVVGTASGQQPDFGVKIQSGDTAFIADSNLTRTGQALLITPQASENSYATKISNSIFDSAGLISGGTQAASCAIAPVGSGNVLETSITGSWCGLSSGADGLLANAGTGVIDGLHISATSFDGNAGSGIHIGGNVKNWDVIGGTSGGNTLNGIYVSGASTHWTVMGLKAGTMSQRGANGQYGVNIGPAAHDYYNVIGNDTNGSVSGGLFDGGTGTHKNVQYNF